MNTNTTETYKISKDSLISDVIETLKEIKEKYGDIIVLCNDFDYCSAPVDMYTLRKYDGVVDGVHLGD